MSHGAVASKGQLMRLIQFIIAHGNGSLQNSRDANTTLTPSKRKIQEGCLQDPGEGLPVLLERPLVLGAGGVVVVGHLGKLLLRDGLVLHDQGRRQGGGQGPGPLSSPNLHYKFKV